MSQAETVFSKEIKSKKSEAELKKEGLLKVIGQQKVEIYFLKNALRWNPSKRKEQLLTKYQVNFTNHSAQDENLVVFSGQECSFATFELLDDIIIVFLMSNDSNQKKKLF